jgi:hypothetical protein
MPKKLPSNAEKIDALNFIVNVLNEHANELGKRINELGPIAKRIGKKGELSNAFERIEEKIGSLQNDMANSAKFLLTSPQETKIPVATADFEEHQNNSAPAFVASGSPTIVQCNLWEDFQVLAAQAQTVTFMHKESDKPFEANAFKNNQLFVYIGEMPDLTSLLRIWLSKQLDVSEKKVVEGTLTTD